MKKLLIVSLILITGFYSQAQFTKARLQATGLTCAMCSNAVNKALQQLSFVEKVYSDIKNSAFNIQFKKDAAVDIDGLRLAVEDAGFSVGNLKLTGNFNEVKIENDHHIRIGVDNFHFLKVSKQVLNGEQTLTIVDKDFLTAKEQKKYDNATDKSCYKNGKAADCCVKDGVPQNSRIYHVTI